MSNEKKYICITVLNNIVDVFINGAIFITFLKYWGMSGSKISSLNFAGNIICVLANILLVFILDKIIKIKRDYCICCIANVIYCCIILFVNLSFAHLGDVAISIAAGMFCARKGYAVIFSQLYEKLPYRILNMNNIVDAENGIIIPSLIMGILVNGAYTLLGFVIDFRYLITIFMSINIVFAVTIVLIVCSLKENDYGSESIGETRGKRYILGLISMLKKPYCIITNSANLFRGIAYGIIGMVPAVMASEISSSGGALSFMAIAVNLSSFIVGIIYLKFLRRDNIVKFIILGSIISSVSLTVMILFKNVVYFYIIYILMLIGNSCIDRNILIYYKNIVPYENYGRFTTTREIIVTFGMAVGAYVCSLFIDQHPYAVLAFAGICKLIFGLIIMLFSGKIKEIKF